MIPCCIVVFGYESVAQQTCTSGGLERLHCNFPHCVAVVPSVFHEHNYFVFYFMQCCAII